MERHGGEITLRNAHTWAVCSDGSAYLTADCRKAGKRRVPKGARGVIWSVAIA